MEQSRERQKNSKKCSYFKPIGTTIEKSKYEAIQRICRKLGTTPGALIRIYFDELIAKHEGNGLTDEYEKAFNNIPLGVR